MLKAWMIDDPYTVLPYLIPSTQVVVRKTAMVVSHPPQAICVKGINHLTCRLSSARFSYIPASGGSGMQISPPDTVTKQPLWCGALARLARGKSSKRPQAENSAGIRPTDGSMAILPNEVREDSLSLLLSGK